MAQVSNHEIAIKQVSQYLRADKTTNLHNYVVHEGLSPAL